MKRWIFILCSVVIFLLAGCSALATPQPTPGEDETYQVYSALLDSVFGQGGKWGQVVIEDTTSVDSITLPQLENPDLTRFSKLNPGLIAALAQSNQQPLHLESRFSAAGKVVLIGQADLDAIFKHGQTMAEWAAFAQAYSGARSFYTFSRVVFNASGDQALVYYSTRCGGLCGGGNLVQLAKESGAWVVKFMQMTWIS